MKRYLWTLALLFALVAPTRAQNTVGRFKKLIDVVDARTIASNGGGTAATLTLTPNGSYVAITCNDTDGCAITMGETGAQDGQVLVVVNVSANAVTFSNSSGVSELPSSISLAQWRAIYLKYVTDRWVYVTSSATGSGTVTTTGSPASGNLAKFSGATSVTNADLTGDVTTSGTAATTVASAAITYAKFQNLSALGVFGRSTNSSGVGASITAAAASDGVLRESGSTIGFGTVATAGIANNAVTFPKLVNASAASRFMCRGSAAGSGNWEECTLGLGLSLNGTQLTASGGGGGGGGGSSVFPVREEGRLTTESGVPVSTTDRTSQGTLYWTPCVYHNVSCFAITTGVITLWNGTDAVDFATTQLSKTITGLTSGKNYDVFIDYNSGAPQIVLSAAWSSDTARTDALSSQYDSTRQVTLIIKSGTPAYRWVGVIRTTGTTTIEDSGGITGTTQVGGKRFVWNAYNQVPRTLSVIDTTDTWSYTTNTIRQANASGGGAGNQVEYVTGDAASFIEANVLGNVKLANSSSNDAKVGIGIDSTTAFSGVVGENYNSNAGGTHHPTSGRYEGTPGLGYHYIAWLEKGGDGTCVFVGDDGATGVQSGLKARIWN